MKKIILALTIICVASVSCKKDKKNCDLNAGNLVGSYKVTSVSYKATATATPEDLFATYDACEKDDVTVLNSNNTVTYTDAGTTCTPSGNDTGIWAFSGNQLIIDAETYTVSSFSCDGATIVYTDGSGGVTTTTLAKQ